MKSTFSQRQSAFTLTELIVVMVVLMILILWASTIGMPPSAERKAQRISCLNNLKEIDVAYRLWADDHGGHTPASESTGNGGWSELLTNAGQGANCWTNYAILANALGGSPKVLMCPADDRFPAGKFLTNAEPNNPRTNYFQNNSNLSYFVGVSANTNTPRSLLAGDRNLGCGTESDSDFGFSPRSVEGNDVAIPITGPVCWSLKMHSAGNLKGAGNILMGDGSAQQASTASFNTNWLQNTIPTTNWPAGHIPPSASIRLVFP